MSRQIQNISSTQADAGNLLQRAWKNFLNGKLADAENGFRQVLVTLPHNSDAIHFLGLVLNQQGLIEAAIPLMERSIELLPDNAIFRSNFGSVLRHAGRLEESESQFRRAIEIEPNNAAAFNNLGITLHMRHRNTEAIAAFRKSISLTPTFAKAINNLAICQLSDGDVDGSIESLHKAIQMSSGIMAEAHVNLGKSLMARGEIAAAVQNYLLAVAHSPLSSVFMSCLLFSVHFDPAFTTPMILEQHRIWSERFAEPLRPLHRQFVNDRTRDRRLRIGYVSTNFKDHVQALLVLPFLLRHDHVSFEIVCFSNVVAPDEITARYRQASDRWRNIFGLSDEAVAKLIVNDEIDVLVDLDMHMADSRILLFGRKPAPIQFTYCYPGTTGISDIDYRITDVNLDPEVGGDGPYAEKSIRLPDTYWVYAPLDTDLAPRSNRDDSDRITFGCLNNICKINSSILALWARVLQAVDGSRLLLLAPVGSARNMISKCFTDLGIEPNRIEYSPYAPRREYLLTYQRIDIALDTSPYNGHTTTLDALWMGVPVVSLVGKTVVGRAGLSLLRNMGLSELAATTESDFVQIAAGLANDRARLSQLHRELRRTMERSPLMDAERYTRELESAYRFAWQHWCSDANRLEL